MVIVKSFELSSFGLVIILDEVTYLPIRIQLSAIITHPDGTTLNAKAFKEYMYSSRISLDKEAFRLKGLTKQDAPIGSTIQITV